jgi:hypothetical protein
LLSTIGTDVKSVFKIIKAEKASQRLLPKTIEHKKKKMGRDLPRSVKIVYLIGDPY